MAIQSRKNQYVGVNAHLNSVLQNEPYDWESFHSEHLAHIRDALQDQLPEGYFARLERSLQIRIEGNGSHKPSRTRPDIFVSYAKALRRAQGGLSGAGAASPTARIAIAKTLQRDDEDYLDAIVIYRVEASGRIGIPVTRLELLSPVNKPPKGGYQQYLDKREDTLRSGIRLVELDYLHQTRSPILILPDYPAREKGASPFTILVSDPRPTVDEGEMLIYSFGVDEAIPIVNIPLADADLLSFDFGAVYNHTFEHNPYYRLVVDYAQLPERFDTYSEADQTRIRARMGAVMNAHQQGLDLEQGPFPVEDN
jgi:hypothetical protein